MADKIDEQSSKVYMLDPAELRRLGLEKGKKSRDDCYGSHKCFKGQPKADTLADRQQRWDELKETISEGFDPRFPIIVMINRKNGNTDQIFQGHHRLAIAIELGLDRVPVRFVTKKKKFFEVIIDSLLPSSSA